MCSQSWWLCCQSRWLCWQSWCLCWVAFCFAWLSIFWGLEVWLVHFDLSPVSRQTVIVVQTFAISDISTATTWGVHVKVIAGSALGQTSSLRTRTPATFLDVTLDPAASLTQALTPGWNAFIYIFEGMTLTNGIISLAIPKLKWMEEGLMTLVAPND